jgi:hypothetical protein
MPVSTKRAPKGIGRRGFRAASFISDLKRTGLRLDWTMAARGGMSRRGSNALDSMTPTMMPTVRPPSGHLFLYAASSSHRLRWAHRLQRHGGAGSPAEHGHGRCGRRLRPRRRTVHA